MMIMEKVLPKKIIKRDGSSVPFDSQKIENAIYRAALEALQDEKEARHVSEQATQRVLERTKERAAATQDITVESIQDIVEEVLMETGHHLTAKSYILYRKRHEELRETKSIYGIHLDELGKVGNTGLLGPLASTVQVPIAQVDTGDGGPETLGQGDGGRA